MENNYYKFITRWKIEASINDVWYAIYKSEEWPNWWKGVIQVKIIKENDEQGINGIRQYKWKSLLPYTLSFKMQLIEKRDFVFLKGIAVGELEGDGTWYFKEENAITNIQYNWNVKTNKAWMNYFAIILKPIFKFNHNIIMKWGAEGLAKKLNAKLISV
ncbi:MAG: SRPBCC family protein [Parafilimonas sp.]|nr:SRPBCC family protein [Parafilimonas sp.]